MDDENTKMLKFLTEGLLGFKNVDTNLKELYVKHFLIAMKEYNLKSKVQICHFLAQVYAETSGLQRLKEIDKNNEGYAYLLGKGVEIEGVMIKNETLDDCKNYCGKGPIQLTHKGNYFFYGKMINLDLLKNPDLAREPEYMFKIALTYWNYKGCNKEEGSDDDSVRRITLIIQGGSSQIEKRITAFRNMFNAYDKCFN